MSVARKACVEIDHFFALGATSTAILEYRPSVEAQDRVRYLLAKNKVEALTPDEAAELELFGELEHFMQFVKARAYQNVTLEL